MAPKPKLTIVQISEINRLAREEGKTQVELAKLFSVNRDTIAKALAAPPPEGAPERGFTQAIGAEFLFPSPANPRKTFDPEALQELAYSIATNGLMQNLVVRPVEDGEGALQTYQIVAGERRFRAITQLIENGQWDGPIPCLVKDLSAGEQRKRQPVTALA